MITPKPKPKDHRTDWKEAKTLPEVIYKLVRMKKMASPEFQSILKFYGKLRVRELYEKEKMKREGK